MLLPLDLQIVFFFFLASESFLASDRNGLVENLQECQIRVTSALFCGDHRKRRPWVNTMDQQGRLDEAGRMEKGKGGEPAERWGRRMRLDCSQVNC